MSIARARSRSPTRPPPASPIRDNLGCLASDYGVPPPCHGKIATILRRQLSHGIDRIFEYGLHEYLQDLLAELGQLDWQIESDDRFCE